MRVKKAAIHLGTVLNAKTKMEQNQEDTHEPLKSQPVNQFDTDNVEIESAPPQDKNDIHYIVLIAIGIGFALPFYRFAF